MIRNLEVVGEASNKILAIDPTFLARYPQTKLDLAYRMRNALIHGYYAINLTTVWNTVHGELATLKQQLRGLSGSD